MPRADERVRAAGLGVGDSVMDDEDEEEGLTLDRGEGGGAPCGGCGGEMVDADELEVSVRRLDGDPAEVGGQGAGEGHVDESGAASAPLGGESKKQTQNRTELNVVVRFRWHGNH